MRYAKVQNSTNSIVGEKKYDSFDAAAVAHKFGPDKEFRIIPIVRLDDPVIDTPETHRYGPQVETVKDTVVERVRSVIPIPQEELDAKAELDLWKNRHDMFDSGSATNAQVQKYIAFQIRKDLGIDV